MKFTGLGISRYCKAVAAAASTPQPTIRWVLFGFDDEFCLMMFSFDIVIPFLPGVGIRKTPT
ncbi:MAG: hypothetical protein ACLR5R_01360 [Eubacterium sp.]|uniref:hypothetical protein n=1 Tax=Eubacterium sp. TaxID=142586 RepID=UPI0039A29763